jgi:hypothetical protein
MKRTEGISNREIPLLADERAEQISAPPQRGEKHFAPLSKLSELFQSSESL